MLQELELRWQEYYELVTMLIQWIRHHILVFEERKFPTSYEEIEVQTIALLQRNINERIECLLLFFYYSVRFSGASFWNLRKLSFLQKKLTRTVPKTSINHLRWVPLHLGGALKQHLIRNICCTVKPQSSRWFMKIVKLWLFVMQKVNES